MLLVLLGAALHAGWNALVKSGADKLVDTVVVAAGAATLSAAALPFLPAPAPESWPCIAASALIHVAYFSLVAAAYQAGEMGLAYPLMRGTAPLMVALLGGALLGERLGAGALLGVLLISGGVLALALDRRPRAAGIAGSPGRAVALALLNAVVIAAYTLVDGLGARLSGQPASYTLWVFLLTALPLLALAAARRPGAFLARLGARWRTGLAGGGCTLASYALALWAMTQAPIAMVAALRETSILFGVAIATLVLRERSGWARHAAAGAIACGAAALRLA